MDKRLMGKTGETVSRLGMGMMRLPRRDGEIDEAAAQAMVDTLMANGVTYYDTAFFYHGGKSEPFTGRALSRFPRESYTVATKLPIGEVEKNGGVEALSKLQFERLSLEMVDFHLLHGIDYRGWQYSKRLGADSFQEKAKKEGRIRFKGFSFHGPAADFPKILDECDWDFAQIQLNYYDWFLGDAKALYEAAESRGVPLVVMEPVRGGSLHNCHADVKKVLSGAAPDKSAASWALRWVGSLPAVDIVLSGMSSMEQAEDNLSLFSPLVPLSEEENAVVLQAVEAFKKLPLIPCTGCNYCDKCPQHISIPRLLQGYNDVLRFGHSWYLQNYRQWEKDKLADSCTACGVCEAACPQKINIIERIREVYEKHT